MSFAEILAEVDKLSIAECEELAARLQIRRDLSEPGFLSELSDRLDDMESGRASVSAEVLAQRLQHPEQAQ